MQRNLFRHLAILFAEDDATVLEDVGYTLRAYFKAVYTADNGEAALALFDEHEPDIVLTDIRMPGMGGIELVRRIRETDASTPIIMMTAYSDEKTLLQAVSLYLFDYLVKPVTHAKLIDVLMKCVRQHPTFARQDFTLTPECRYSFDEKSVICDGQRIDLTHQEILFLELLIEQAGQAVDYDAIDYHVWQERDMSKNALKTLVKKIRAKLPENVIKNIVGYGYKLQQAG